MVVLGDWRSESRKLRESKTRREKSYRIGRKRNAEENMRNFILKY